MYVWVIMNVCMLLCLQAEKKRQERKQCATPSIEEALRLLSFFLSFFACLEGSWIPFFFLFLPCILLHLAFAKRFILFCFGFWVLLAAVSASSSCGKRFHWSSMIHWASLDNGCARPRENIERHSHPCSTTMGMMNCNGSEYSWSRFVWVPAEVAWK